MATGRKGPKTVEKKAAGNGAGEHAIVATVRSLAELVTEHSLSELIVDLPDTTITLRRGPGGAIAAMPMSMPIPMPQMSVPGMPGMTPAGMTPFTSHAAHGSGAIPIAAPVEHDNAHVVTCPFVGTFYRRPNPDSPNYVAVGEKVEKGAVLCIVEAMKLMNEIEADVAGIVVGVLAEDGAPVEYGQPLFRIAPA